MVLEPSWRDIAGVFFRRKLTVIVTFLVVLGAGVGYVLYATPLYRSDATLLVRFGADLVPAIGSRERPTQQLASNERREMLNSDGELLKSADLIRGIIGKLGLAALYPKIAATTDSDRLKLASAQQAFASDLVVDVSGTSDAINLSYLNHDPALAHRAMQLLVDTYIDHESKVYSDPQLLFMQNEREQASKRLDDARATLADFKERNQISDLPQQISQALLQRSTLTAQLQGDQAHVALAEKRQAALAALLAKVPANVSSQAGSEKYRGVDDTQAKLADLQSKQQQMLSTFQPNSRILGQLQAGIASLQAAQHHAQADARGRDATQPNVVYQNIQTDYLRAVADADSAREPIAILRQELAANEQRLSTLERSRNPLDDLTRRAQIAEDAYKALADRYEEARVGSNRNDEKISSTAVISVPSVPDLPARPRKKIVLAGSLVAGLILGMGLALLLEALDDRIYAPREALATLRLPVLATFGKEA